MHKANSGIKYNILLKLILLFWKHTDWINLIINITIIIWPALSVPNSASLLNDKLKKTIENKYKLLINGCVSLDSLLVTPIPEIYYGTGFTPNGDGVNDVWEIDRIDDYPNCVVEIYNRWGEQLFRSVGYAQKWDGEYNNKPLPVGTYYYVIELNDPKFPDPYTGPITIMR